MFTKYFKYTEASNEFTKIVPRPVSTEEVSYYSKPFISVTGTEEEIQSFIDNQDNSINLTEISDVEFKEGIKDSDQIKKTKEFLRTEIRNMKDIEDDLTDTKIVLQNILFFISDLWENVLTEDQKNLSKYKEVLPVLVQSLKTNKSKS